MKIERKQVNSTAIIAQLEWSKASLLFFRLEMNN